MSKFIMECPSCHNYTEARTGFFASKKINCHCGYVIDIKTDRLTTKKCMECGNVVAFDQANGERVVCPVCKKKLYSKEDFVNLFRFRCSRCGSTINADKNHTSVICPICDSEQNVQHALHLYNSRASEEKATLLCECSNTFMVWKHPNTNFAPGACLIVNSGQEAVFLRDGETLGPYTAGNHTLTAGSKENFTLSEVYFVNIAPIPGLKWGTGDQIRINDVSSEIYYQIGASGSFSIRVSDSLKFLSKTVGTVDKVTIDQLLNGNMIYFRQMVIGGVKAHMAAVIKSSKIKILEIDEHIAEINEKLKELINRDLAVYGVALLDFNIHNILYPEDDANFKRMKQQYADRCLNVREEKIKKEISREAYERKLEEANKESDIKVIEARADANVEMILAHAEAEKKRMLNNAELDAIERRGYTYQQETERLIQLEATKKGMVPNGWKSSAQNSAEEPWNCKCGKKGIAGKFCPDCGERKPEPDAAWNCKCGKKGITSKFCPDCGGKKPEPDAAWNCKCGKKGITSKFCPDCGGRKPEPDGVWNCKCGKTGITSRFCPNCGSAKVD